MTNVLTRCSEDFACYRSGCGRFDVAGTHDELWREVLRKHKERLAYD
jgi:hypothetical protein